MSLTYRFKSRERRDELARKLTKEGRNLRKSSSRSVALSPDYIADEAPDAGNDNGFGGKSPQFYPVIYTLEVS